MRFILDTHVVLWWLDDPGLLSETARNAIAEPSNEIFVSAASAWEIAIKRGLGKLQTEDHFMEAILACGFKPLAMTMAHALATEELPPHHRDPFDRMLISQAICEGATLITRDSTLMLYGIPIIRA